MGRPQSEKGRRWGWRRYVATAAVLLVVVAAVTVLVVRQSRTVRWSEVMEAVSKQRTINGVGRVYAPDGTEWASSTWVQVRGPGDYPANSLLLPVKAAPKQQPDEETVGIAQMANYLPLLTRLAKNHPSTVGRPSEWGGRQVLEATYAERHGGLGSAGGFRFAARMYIDPQSKLVQHMELLVQDKPVLRVDYRYGLPLPKGFKAS